MQKNDHKLLTSIYYTCDSTEPPHAHTMKCDAGTAIFMWAKCHTGCHRIQYAVSLDNKRMLQSKIEKYQI